MDDRRRAVLRDLIDFNRPIRDLRMDLGEFPWDIDEELITLTAGDVDRILRRYLAGELSAKEVEDWAETLEVREDVGFDELPNEQVLEAVHFLANPCLHGDLTEATAREWIVRLTQ